MATVVECCQESPRLHSRVGVGRLLPVRTPGHFGSPRPTGGIPPRSRMGSCRDGLLHRRRRGGDRRRPLHRHGRLDRLDDDGDLLGADVHTTSVRFGRRASGLNVTGDMPRDSDGGEEAWARRPDSGRPMARRRDGSTDRRGRRQHPNVTPYLSRSRPFETAVAVLDLLRSLTGGRLESGARSGVGHRCGWLASKTVGRHVPFSGNPRPFGLPGPARGR